MTVTFDFDDTLTKPIQNENGLWVCSNQPYNEIINGVFQTHVDNGDEIHIVTTRLKSNPVDKFLETHELVSKIERVWYTNGVSKTSMLQDIGCDLHYDDCMYQVIDCIKHDIRGIVIVHPFDINELSFENVEHIITDYCKRYRTKA